MKQPTLKQSDVVFMYTAENHDLKAYDTTMVGWGGANTQEQVQRHHDLGIRCTGSMWCLTAGPKLIHEDPLLGDAVARDIQGKPVDVPWQRDKTYKGTKTHFGCTNHPAFRKHNRERVRAVMAGGADGLHVDDHAGVSAAAWQSGGGLCDHCVEAFREYCRRHVKKNTLEKAGVTNLDSFDYRKIIRRYARTRETYMNVQHRIPLMKQFLLFHARASAQNVKELGELGEQMAGHPILLSANACIPRKLHTYILPYLTHIICEVNHFADKGFARLSYPVRAYGVAEKNNCPAAVTAHGTDWAFVKANNATDMVKTWIALAYAHGQRFMVPHPTRQYCHTRELGTHWYAAPVETFAPLYKFIRKNQRLFDDHVSTTTSVRCSSKRARCTVRAGKKDCVIHAVNTALNRTTNIIAEQNNVKIELPHPVKAKSATLFAFDQPNSRIPIHHSRNSAWIEIPRLTYWGLAKISE